MFHVRKILIYRLKYTLIIAHENNLWWFSFLLFYGVYDFLFLVWKVGKYAQENKEFANSGTSNFNASYDHTMRIKSLYVKIMIVWADFFGVYLSHLTPFYMILEYFHQSH